MSFAPAFLGCVSYLPTSEQAAATNNVRGIGKLTKKHGVDVNARMDNGRTAMFAAAYAGHADAIKVPAIYHLPPPSATPFMRTRPQTLQALVEAGGDVCLKDDDGATPLHFACFSGCSPGKKCRCTCGISLAFFCLPLCARPLLLGTRPSCLEPASMRLQPGMTRGAIAGAVDAILQAGADPNLPDPFGSTPLLLVMMAEDAGRGPCWRRTR